MVDEQKLRQLAEDATPGPWSYEDDLSLNDGHNVMSGGYYIAECFEAAGDQIDSAPNNAMYISSANPSAILSLLDELKTLRKEQTAWQKQCDTLTHQVICCGVAASHPDATLTTRGAYAGKWNSAQAEEVRKLRAECDQMREERTAWRVTAENAEKDRDDADSMSKALSAVCDKNDARWKFLHTINKDAQGFELCVMRVKWENGRISEALHTNSDMSDMDAAIDAAMKEES